MRLQAKLAEIAQLGWVDSQVEDKVIAAALHQEWSIEIEHDPLRCVAFAAAQPLELCRRERDLQHWTVPVQVDAHLQKPVSHLQRHLIAQADLVDVSQLFAPPKPSQLALDATEPEVRLQQVEG